MARGFTFLMLFFFSQYATICLAHGDLHERIQAVSKQIAQHPEDLELYQQRGELHMQHGSYRDAIRDFRYLRRRNSTSERLLFCLAKSYYHLGSFRKCIRHLTFIQKKGKSDTKTQRLMAKAYERQGRFEKALECYRIILETAILAHTDNYLDIANIFEQQKMPLEEAAILEKGIEAKGMLPCFYLRLLTIYQNEKHFEAALNLQSQLIEMSDRKEFMLFERARTYHLMGNESARSDDLGKVLKEIEKLPTHIQQNKSVQDLLAQVKTIQSTKLSPK